MPDPDVVPAQPMQGRVRLAADPSGTWRSNARPLELYTHALWERILQPKARPALGQPTERASEDERPTLESGTLLLPARMRDPLGGPARELYRAAIAHAGAHVTWSLRRFRVGNYKPIKLVVVSLLEDARVEALAIRSYPGLRRLWSQFHRVTPEAGDLFETLAARLARALLDPDYRDPNPWIAKGRALFAAASDRLEDQGVCIEIASPLANDIGQLRLQFNYKTYLVAPEYRDDNACLWDWSDAPAPPPDLADVDEIVLEEVRTNPQETPDTLDTPLREAEILEPGEGSDEREAPAAIAVDFVLRTVRYSEWDYVIGKERVDWCTLNERHPIRGDARAIDVILQSDADLLSRIRRLIRASRAERLRRLRKQHEGERLDLDQALRAAIDLRRGRTPDPRIHVRTEVNRRSISVLVLVDLSKSTGDLVRGSTQSVLDLAREAVVLLAQAMNELGDRFAIHGFTSNGRTDVTYYRIADFGQGFDEAAKSAMAGLAPQLSTRMGAAIRHAGRALQEQASEHRLLLLITDGEPSDIDVFDRQYLTHDARKAVEELRRTGVRTFCLSLDPQSDRYVSRIFGARNYTVVTRVASLPEKLPMLYLRLTAA